MESTWHTEPLEDLFKRLQVKDPQKGITLEQAARKLADFGFNELQVEQETPFKIMTDTLIQNKLTLLVTALIIALIALQRTEGPMVILSLSFIILWNWIPKFFATMSQVDHNIGPPVKLVRAFREGNLLIINEAHLVPGDIVYISTGQLVPADIRILESENLYVDNSSLTGESLSIAISPDNIKENILMSQNILFKGTIITSGIGKGIVVNTGTRTLIGRIAHLTQATDDYDDSTRLMNHIFVMALGFTSILMVFGFLAGENSLFQILIIFELIIIKAVENFTVCRNIVKRIIINNLNDIGIFTKQLEKVNMLPEVNAYCISIMSESFIIDKLFYDFQIINADSISNEMKQSLFFKLSCVATTAIMDQTGDVTGSAIEGTVLQLISEKLDYMDIRKNCPTLHASGERGHAYSKICQGGRSIGLSSSRFAVKISSGCDEFNHVSRYLSSNGIAQIGENEQFNTPEKIIEVFQHGSPIIISFVEIPDDISVSKEYLESNLGWIIAGVYDLGVQINPKLSEIYEKAAEADVHVLMISDHPIQSIDYALESIGLVKYPTTKSTSTDLDDRLSNDGTLYVIGSEMVNLYDNKWREIVLHKNVVLVELSIAQKIEVIRQLHQLNYTVAAYGYKTGDLPFMKSSNLGLTGFHASDIAKNAADALLYNNNPVDLIDAKKYCRSMAGVTTEMADNLFISAIPIILAIVLTFATQIEIATIPLLMFEIGTTAMTSLMYSHPGPRYFSGATKSLLQMYFGFLSWLAVVMSFGLFENCDVNDNCDAKTIFKIAMTAYLLFLAISDSVFCILTSFLGESPHKATLLVFGVVKIICTLIIAQIKFFSLTYNLTPVPFNLMPWAQLLQFVAIMILYKIINGKNQFNLIKTR